MKKPQTALCQIHYVISYFVIARNLYKTILLYVQSVGHVFNSVLGKCLDANELVV